MKRILLIDNQKTQYQKIAGKLNEYQIFPGPEYNDFMNWVRIWVTVTYSGPRQKLVFAEIINKIRQWNIDLFILDYKIAGNTEGSTGIFLGQRLKAEFNKPIIYLSRTPYNSKDLGDEKYHVKQENWIEKGYTGLNILDEPYFDLNVRKKIQKMLSTQVNEEISHEEKVQELSKTNLFNVTLLKYFRVVKETIPPGEPEIKVVNQLYAARNTVTGNETFEKILLDYIKSKNG